MKLYNFMPMKRKKDGGKYMVKRKKKIHQCILKKMKNEWTL